MKPLPALAVAMTLSLHSLAQQAEQRVVDGAARATPVAVGPDELIWSTGDLQSGGRIVEVGTGMNYWDGQNWVHSIIAPSSCFLVRSKFRSKLTGF